MSSRRRRHKSASCGSGLASRRGSRASDPLLPVQVALLSRRLQVALLSRRRLRMRGAFLSRRDARPCPLGRVAGLLPLSRRAACAGRHSLGISESDSERGPRLAAASAAAHAVGPSHARHSRRSGPSRIDGVSRPHPRPSLRAGPCIRRGRGLSGALAAASHRRAIALAHAAPALAASCRHDETGPAFLRGAGRGSVLSRGAGRRPSRACRGARCGPRP